MFFWSQINMFVFYFYAPPFFQVYPQTICSLHFETISTSPNLFHPYIYYEKLLLQTQDLCCTTE